MPLIQEFPLNKLREIAKDTHQNVATKMSVTELFPKHKIANVVETQQ